MRAELLISTILCASCNEGESLPPPPPDADAPLLPLDSAAVRPTAACRAGSVSTESRDPIGPFELIAGEMYVVYSELRQTDNPGFIETSNIFVMRGEEDSAGVDVWIFGTGYGDGAGLAYFPYPRTVQYATRSGDADAGDVDAIIRNCLAITPQRARLRLITPHYHFDHMNSEFVDGLVARGFPLDRLALYVHALDYDATFCGQPCAGTSTGGGALPAFSAAVEARAVRLGSATDSCGASVFSFVTPASGTWNVRSDPGGHTPGTLALDNTQLGVRLKGAAQSCLAREGLNLIEQHKGIGMAWAQVQL